jgi:hypothetical protein
MAAREELETIYGLLILDGRLPFFPINTRLRRRLWYVFLRGNVLKIT